MLYNLKTIYQKFPLKKQTYFYVGASVLKNKHKTKLNWFKELLTAKCILRIFVTVELKSFTFKFNVYWSVHRKYIPIYIQQNATLHSLFISGNCSNGVTNIRCCRYSFMRSWPWVEVLPETCRAVFRFK